MVKKYILLLVAVFATVVFVGCSAKPAENNKAATPAPTTPSAATEKPAGTARVVVDLKNQKNGCKDCHAPGAKIKLKDGTEKDVSLAAEAQSIPNHPPVAATATVKDCFVCHKRSEENRVAWVTKLHDVHLNSTAFTVTYKQTCSGCHDMKTIKQ